MLIERIPQQVMQRIAEIDPEHWKQISRTVNGVPVDSAQIGLMAEAIIHGLDLSLHDNLVDIGCGNGALASVLAPVCHSVRGIDPDARLLEVAERIYGCDDRLSFERGQLPDQLPGGSRNPEATKGLVYGVFAYVPQPHKSLSVIREAFPNLERLFVGQIPNAACKSTFTAGVSPERLQSLQAALGQWFYQDDFVSMAKEAGWSANVTVMPKTFYSAHYRFDALLRRTT